MRERERKRERKRERERERESERENAPINGANMVTLAPLLTFAAAGAMCADVMVMLIFMDIHHGCAMS